MEIEKVAKTQIIGKLPIYIFLINFQVCYCCCHWYQCYNHQTSSRRSPFQGRKRYIVRLNTNPNKHLILITILMTFGRVKDLLRNHSFPSVARSIDTLSHTCSISFLLNLITPPPKLSTTISNHRRWKGLIQQSNIVSNRWVSIIHRCRTDFVKTILNTVKILFIIGL